MADYTPEKKAEVLRDIKRMGNMSKVASKHGVSRQTLYNWQEKEDEILEEAAKNDEILTLKERSEVQKDVLEGIETYRQLLEAKGSLEERKKFLANKTEHLVFRLVDLIERNPELEEMSPDRQAKVLQQVNDIKKDALGEPDYIIEYRNNWMELVLRVLTDFLTNSEIKEFVSRIERMEEAEYEIL